MNNQILVLNRIEECYSILELKFDLSFPRPNAVLFNVRGYTIAGKAFCAKNELHFNQTILDNNVEKFIEKTVAHEVAHLITGQLFPYTRGGTDLLGSKRPAKPHGWEWKSIMGLLGVPANVYHTYASPGVDYSCTICGTVVSLSPIRHKKCKTKGVIYNHRGCSAGELVEINA